MGNCCRSASSSVWAGDDWGSMIHDKHQVTMFDEADDHEEHGASIGRRRPLDTSCSSSGSTREVKIKITKRELEEIVMERVNMQGLSMEEVLLARSILEYSSSDHEFEMEHPHGDWKPSLQSIPELN
ncbi:hypothetical protein Peur_061884 [Populus x canadensis]|uniref:Uncharacterized protein n=1 Tax=Populus deltoides TaxID=3696 RepID=A0A8T2XJY6_POPDE|nr:hypothetical protein H0E87_020129 [Populus deltoides]